MRRKINQAADHGELFIASISVWEVGMLAAKRRIQLGGDTLDWVNASFKRPGLSLAELTPEIAVASSYLPGVFHGDPADRILVATARLRDLFLVTADEKIIEYGRQGFVKVIPI